MPGRDKSLITRNGIPDPQAYNPQTGQWESFIGVSWGKTAGGLYVPIRVDDQGRQEVTLSGTKVLYVTLLNAVAFTSDASTSYSVRSLLGLTEGEFLQIKSIVFGFLDSHDKSGRLLLTARGPSGAFPAQCRIYENNAFFRSGIVEVQIGDFGEIVGDGFIKVPALGRMNFTDIQINVKFDAPPTAGALTITSIIKY